MVIHKIRADHVIDFAAEELKKYLRMMMPQCDEINIVFDPAAKAGFRLGLLADFGLDSEAEDVLLDDVVHTSTRLEARFPSHGSGAMTGSPSPLAWRPDFPGAPREAH